MKVSVHIYFNFHSNMIKSPNARFYAIFHGIKMKEPHKTYKYISISKSISKHCKSKMKEMFFLTRVAAILGIFFIIKRGGESGGGSVCCGASATAFRKEDFPVILATREPLSKRTNVPWNVPYVLSRGRGIITKTLHGFHHVFFHNIVLHKLQKYIQPGIQILHEGFLDQLIIAEDELTPPPVVDELRMFVAMQW